jgi:hypothetical protein
MKSMHEGNMMRSRNVRYFDRGKTGLNFIIFFDILKHKQNAYSFQPQVILDIPQAIANLEYEGCFLMHSQTTNQNSVLTTNLIELGKSIISEKFILSRVKNNVLRLALSVYFTPSL